MSDTAWRKEPPDSEGWWWRTNPDDEEIVRIIRTSNGTLASLEVGWPGEYDIHDGGEWQKVEGPKP